MYVFVYVFFYVRICVGTYLFLMYVILQVYVTYHVDVGETPFFVALDHHKRTIVVSIRGTISMKVRNIYLFNISINIYSFIIIIYY